MSYRFNFSYKSKSQHAVDLIIPTKKGSVEGNIPKGVIVPIGYMHARKEVFEFLKQLEQDESIHIYTAKHCDNENVLTHIAPPTFISSYGVNRFGIFLTKTKIESNEENGNIMIDGTGWFRRTTVSDIHDVWKFL